MSGEKLLLEALIKISRISMMYPHDRFAVFHIAHDAIKKYKADTVINYITKESSEPSQIPNCS